MKLGFPRGSYGAALLLALFVLVLNLNALGAFFVGDDYDFLRLLGRADSFGDAAKLQFWGEWEPVWYVSWYADMQIWGFNVFGFHLTNVLWLAAGVIALFALLRLVWPESPRAAWAAALLFAVHPLHDEAVTYLAARGHVICLALMLLSLCAYARARRESLDVRQRSGWIALALVLAFFAALAKETAVILPVWIGAMEWWVLRPERPRRRALVFGLGAGALFLLPAAASMGLRRMVVGLDSGKLRGLAGNWPELFDDLGNYLGIYALLGALPVPFGFLDYPVVQRFAWLGWLLLAVGVLGGIYAFVVAARRPRSSPEWGLVAFGLVIASSSLGPVFWADLSLRRRYLFVPTLGIVLIACVVLHRLELRWKRAATALLVLMVLLGSVGTIQRNELYRGAGAVARDLIETVRGAPIGEPPARGDAEPPKIALINRPARYGGDFLSGAYILHHTDMKSALKLFDVPQRKIYYAMRCEHADDLEAEILSSNGPSMVLRLSYRGERAFLEALQNDPADRPQGRLVRAKRLDVDFAARTLTYAVRVDPRFAAAADAELYLYSDAGLRRVPLGVRGAE